MISKILTVILALSISHVYANVLAQDSPERKQLIAMGAEFLQEKKDDSMSIFNLGGDLFFIDKKVERTVVGRNFIRDKKLNQAEELELHKIINKLNIDNPFQFVLFEKSLQANFYIYSSYDAKVFARIVFAASKVESVFEANPKIYSLINN